MISDQYRKGTFEIVILAKVTVCFLSCALILSEAPCFNHHALFPWGINMWSRTCITTLSTITNGWKTQACQGHEMYQGLLVPKPVCYYKQCLIFLLLHFASEKKKHVKQSKFNCFVKVCWFSLEQKRKIKLQSLVLEAVEIAVALVLVQSASATILSENPQWLHTQASANILHKCYFYENLNLTGSLHFSALQLRFLFLQWLYMVFVGKAKKIYSLLVFTMRYRIWVSCLK